MNILIIGGTSFIGPYVVRNLVSWGHSVTVFSRGNALGTAALPASVQTVTGDRDRLTDFSRELRELSPEVVTDMVAFTTDHARQLVNVFDEPGQRIVMISSIDVYRAYGRYRRTEPGEPDLVPLLEDDPLREKLLPESGTYDKVGIEQIIRESGTDRGTILRLPLVFGPHDKQRRFREYLSLMDAGESIIRLPQAVAEWRCATGYVEDVGLAIALAVKNSKAAGKTYNVADSFAFSRLDYVRAIARAADWDGEVVVGSESAEADGCDYAQHLIVDTTAIRRDLGYAEKIPINEAFQRTVEWERETPLVD